jgi:hypothetical protein
MDGLDDDSTKTAYFGLVIAHCRENYLNWVNVHNITIIDESNQTVPIEWDVVIYEKCDRITYPEYTQIQQNVGSEECTSYLRYIVDHYDNLPEVVYFLQPDSLAWNPNRNNKHTSFSTLKQLVEISAPLLSERSIRIHSKFSDPTDGSKKSLPLGFINMGNHTILAVLVAEPENYLQKNNSKVIDLMGGRGPPYDATSRIYFMPGACFAVRRERILFHPVSYYESLIQEIVNDKIEVRRMCWALENTWHVVFGEPLEIPTSSTIEYWKTGKPAKWAIMNLPQSNE